MKWLGGVLCAGLACACSSKDVSLGGGTSGVDALPDGGAAFGAPVLVSGLELPDGGKATDDDPSLSADLTELFFDSKRAGGSGREDVWQTTRASDGDAWETPVFVAALSSSSRETGVALTADGLTLYFSSDRSGGKGGLDVFVATRPSRSGTWSEPVHVPEVETDGDDLVSAIDPAGEHLYLARRSGEDDDYDLFVATRAGDVWDAPVAIDALNTDEEESDAFAARGGLSLVFTRDEDLMLAERASVTEPFGKPVPLAALNSDDDDRDAWTTPELGVVVFSSNRSGDYRLYEARLR